LLPDGILRSTLSKVAAVEARALRKQLKKDVESVLKSHHIARTSGSPSVAVGTSTGTQEPSTASLGIGSLTTFFKPGKSKRPGYSHAFITHMSTLVLDMLDDADVEETETRIKEEYLRLLDSPVLSKMMRIRADDLNPTVILEEVVKMVDLYKEK
jgi:hypothetical protein